MIEELRQRCHAYIIENLEEFRFIVLNEICEMNGWDMNHILDEENELLIQSYLEAILTNGAWCGSEMIAAVVKLYHVNIIIFTEDFEPWNFTVPDPKKEIVLFYSEGSQKNHYDLVIKVDANPSVHQSQVDGWCKMSHRAIHFSSQ